MSIKKTLVDEWYLWFGWCVLGWLWIRYVVVYRWWDIYGSIISWSTSFWIYDMIGRYCGTFMFSCNNGSVLFLLIRWYIERVFDNIGIYWCKNPCVSRAACGMNIWMWRINMIDYVVRFRHSYLEYHIDTYTQILMVVGIIHSRFEMFSVK